MSWQCDKCYSQNRLSDLNCLTCGNPFTFTFKSGPGASSAAARSILPASSSMFPPFASASSSFGSPAAYVSSYVPGAASASMFPPATSFFGSFGSPGAAVPLCPNKDKAYFVAESKTVYPVCRITPPEREEMFLRAKFTPVNEVLLSKEQPFTREMFGYGARIRDGFDRLSLDEKGVLGKSNFALNDAYMGKSSHAPDQVDAAVLGGIFRTIMDGRFETQKFGIVYRSWSHGINDSTDVCGGNLGRYTSTSVRKNYSDWWGTEVPGSATPNDDGFFATIIIPPNTTSVIPLLLFGNADARGKPDMSDPMQLKTKQYEVLLHPEGRLIDTGYNDTTGYRVMVYLGPEKSDHFSDSVSEILSLDDGKGTNVKGLIESVAISRTGNPAYHAGRKTKRYKRSKRSKQTKK